jgi:predicted DNA-binding transcriptional regulator AlpA
MSDTHRRVLIHRTTPEEVVSLPAADLGGEVLARLGDREGRAAGPGPAQRRDGGVRRPPPCVAPPPSGAQDAHPCRDEQAAAAGVPHFGSRRYLDARQVARRYGISVPAVRKRLQRGQLPPPLAVGRRLLWDEADLDRFDDAHKARYAQRSRRTISS